MTEFEIRELFPAEYGLKGQPLVDLNFEYLVGEFDVVSDVTPDDLQQQLEDYWDRYDEEFDDDEDDGPATERFIYREDHRDPAFIEVHRAALAQLESELHKLPLTVDFVAYVILGESYFLPEDVVFGDRRFE